MLDLDALAVQQPKLVSTLKGHFKSDGERCLRELPERLTRLAARWDLILGDPFKGLSFHYVCRATRSDGTLAVLKVGVVTDEMRNEATMLRLLNGNGMERLLEADLDEGALLLERVEPGEMLCYLSYKDDEAATVAAVDVMRGVWQLAPPDHGLWDLRRWFRSLLTHRRRHGGDAGLYDSALLDRAVALTEELLASTTQPRLLHGDLHHFNILSAQRQPWLAIDPKGLVGDPCFELAAFLRNPGDDTESQEHRRLEILCGSLDLDRARVVDWLFAEMMLNASWDHDSHPAKFHRKVAEAQRLLTLAPG